MAKDKTLALTIKIAGKMDKSLLSALNQSQRQISGFSKTLSKIGTVGLAAMAGLTTATVAGIKACTNEAVKYENEMGDVKKYVEGLVDAEGKVTDEIAKRAKLNEKTGKIEYEVLNGKTYQENYDLIYDSIQKISTQVPLTREYLSEMTAAIGQSGKSIEEMFKFDKNGNIVGGLVKDAAVMAAAWDIEAKEAADYAAKWENSFGIDHDQVMLLANQINYLGANTATTAAEIANAVNQAASLGQLAGIDPATVAAMADAMLATGVASDRVGTSIKRMALNLSKGADMSKKQIGVLNEMGMTAEEVASGLAENGPKMMMDIFKGIGDLPKERQLNAVGQLFGVWAAEGGAKIVDNLDVYENALELVDMQRKLLEEENWSSMQREFDVKSATPEAIKLMRDNAIDMFKVGIGKAFVPLQTKMDESVRNFFLNMTDNLPQLEQLSGTLAELATKGIDKIGKAINDALPYITKALDYVNNNGPEVAETVGKIAAAFVGMKFAPAIEGFLGGAGNLLFGASENGQRTGGLISGLMGAPGNIGTALFGHALKGGGRKGGLISKIGVGAKGAVGGVKGYFGGVLGGLKGVANTKIANGVRNNDFVQIAGQWAQIAANTPIGKAVTGIPGAIGGGIGKVGGNIGGLIGAGKQKIAPVGEALGAVGKLGGAIASPVTGMVKGTLSMFGGLVTGAAPVVLAISGIVLAIDLIGKHAQDIRGIITNVFGDKGGQVFDKFAGKIQVVADFVKGLFADNGVANALAPLRQMIENTFGPNASAAFDGFTTILQSVMGVIGQIVAFAREHVKPIAEGIFNFITQTVAPKLLEIFTAAAPYIAGLFTAIGNAVMNAFTLIAQILETVGPIIGNIITVLLNIGEEVIPVVLQAGTTLFEGINQVIEDIRVIFDDVIQFVKDVFAGDWEAAWGDVVKLFGDIWNGIVDLAKAPINAVIELFNGLFDRIGSIQVPDWVPSWLGGGKTITMPHLDTLAKGGFTNGPSIAGEAGMEAVISFQKSARRDNIALWRQAGRMLGIKEHEIADIGDAGNNGGGDIYFSPQITIMGDADRNEVQAGLRMAMDEFERMYDQMMKRKKRYNYATA